MMHSCSILRDIDSLETERLSEQARLDARSSREQRNETGQFATPSALANDITKAVATYWQANDPIRFLEPALGSGAFYAALLRNFPNEKIVSAVGVERDRNYATVASKIWSDVGLKVVNADFMGLKAPTDDLPNLTLTNPPYVRHHHLTSREKGEFQKLASIVSGGDVSGLSGLYTYFVFAAHEWLAARGIAAWLIPSEFMDVNYGESLRRYLSQKVRLIQIHRFDPSDVQFADALVSSAVVIFRREPPSENHKVLLSHGGTVSDPRSRKHIALKSLRGASKWAPLFNGALSQTSESDTPLSLLFTIKRGIATGANDFFIVTRRELAELGIHERFVRPILPPARLLKSDTIESDAAGFPLIEDQLAVIDTDLSLEQIKRTCIGLWRYLQEGERKGVREAYLLTKRSPWYRQEQRHPAPFVCTYMGRTKADGRTFRFFWNRSKAVAANTYLLLYPEGALKAALANDPAISPQVLKSLNGIEDETLTEQGRVYGGGLFKMEPRELGRVDATRVIAELGLQITTQRMLHLSV